MPRAFASHFPNGRAGIAPDAVDSVCVGNVQQTTADGPYIARHVGLKAGVPVEVPMLTVNRLCGSGFQSIVTAAQEIALGESQVVLTGGAGADNRLVQSSGVPRQGPQTLHPLDSARPGDGLGAAGEIVEDLGW